MPKRSIQYWELRPTLIEEQMTDWPDDIDEVEQMYACAEVEPGSSIDGPDGRVVRHPEMDLTLFDVPEPLASALTALVGLQSALNTLVLYLSEAVEEIGRL